MEVDSSSEFMMSECGPNPELYGSHKSDPHVYSESEMLPPDKMKTEEPLFVVDTTTNFRLDYEIEFETSTPIKNSHDYNNSRSNTALKQHTCWNCNSTKHSLQNCPERKNHRAINMNRQAFLKQKQLQQNQLAAKGKNFRNRSSQRFTRYFVDGTPDQQFSDFTPGKLSDELLSALGLSKNEIPLHVYKMREYGYPSGWLEEAKVEYSGISIYTAPNQRVPFPGRGIEKDDIFSCSLNVKKLHEYPGFNAPCPPDVIDDCKSLGYLEFNSEHSLKRMCERLQVKTVSNPYKRTKLTIFPGDKDDNEETSTKEEICRVKDAKPFDHPPSSPEEGEILDEDETTEDNIEYTDKNIEDVLMTPPSEEIVSEKKTDEQSTLGSTESFTEKKESINDTQLDTNTSTSISSEGNLVANSSNKSFGSIKNETLGTPVLNRFSLYENRPSHDSFSKGMVDMVDHENLPNATGTFAKIKEILKYVRKKITDSES